MTSDLTSEVKWGRWGQKLNFAHFFKSDHTGQFSWPSLTLWIAWPHIWPLRSIEVTEVKNLIFLNFSIIILLNNFYGHPWPFEVNYDLWALFGRACERSEPRISEQAHGPAGPVSEANHVYQSEPSSPRPKGEQCAKRTRFIISKSVNFQNFHRISWDFTEFTK